MYRFLFACYISFHLLTVSGSLLSSWRGDSTFGLSDGSFSAEWRRRTSQVKSFHTTQRHTKWLTGNHKHQSLYCGSFNRASFTLYKLFSLEVMQCLDYAMLKRSAANVYSDMSINLNIHVTF